VPVERFNAIEAASVRVTGVATICVVKVALLTF
jgi:hypothetical protein